MTSQEKVIAQLEAIKKGATSRLEKSMKFYSMPASAAADFADLALAVIKHLNDAATDNVKGFMARMKTFDQEKAKRLFNEGWFNGIAIGYAKLTLKQWLSWKGKQLSEFESQMNKMFDMEDANAAYKAYLKNE